MKITTQLHINRLHIRTLKTLKTPFQGELISELDDSNFESQIKNGIIKVLPFCILDIIKSFLFYDIKTYEIIENTKLNKDKMLYIINNMGLSRSNNFDDHSDYSDNVEHWVFGYFPNEKIELQAVNCYHCGDYISHSKDHHFFSDNIYCKCDIEDDFSDNESSLSDNESSFSDNIEGEITFI